MFNNFFKKRNPEIKIGDIVVCIDDREWNDCEQTIDLVYKKFYKILDINKCNCKDENIFDIGSRFINKIDRSYCSKCNNILVGQGIHWAACYRFRKATEEEEKEYYTNEKENILTQINEYVLKEEYEKAHELQKKL